ncbi:hypothetical protein H4R27_004095 [Coemansia aciculifera]|nr:hypothetical protein H4R27_004095 [Coemansia aciculifera]
MLSRALVSLSRVAVSRSGLVVRGFGASALINKTAVKAAATGGRNSGPAKAKKPAPKAAAAKKSAKPKRAASAAKPKRAAAKPKRVAVKKPKAAPNKKDVHEKVLNSKRPIVALPKQAPSSYSLFVRDMWKGTPPREGGEAQEAVFAAVSREAASAWKALSEAGKQQYHKQHDDLRAQHAQDVRKWWAGVDRAQVALENKRRRRHNRRVAQKTVAGSRLPLLKDPLAPKRPPSAFLVFMKERLTGSSGPVKETCRAFSAEWNSMPDAAKAPYVAAAAVEADVYKSAAAKYASSSSSS